MRARLCYLSVTGWQGNQGWRGGGRGGFGPGAGGGRGRAPVNLATPDGIIAKKRALVGRAELFEKHFHFKATRFVLPEPDALFTTAAGPPIPGW